MLRTWAIRNSYPVKSPNQRRLKLTATDFPWAFLFMFLCWCAYLISESYFFMAFHTWTLCVIGEVPTPFMASNLLAPKKVFLNGNFTDLIDLESSFGCEELKGKWDPLFQENPGWWNIIPFGQISCTWRLWTIETIAKNILELPNLPHTTVTTRMTWTFFFRWPGISTTKLPSFCHELASFWWGGILELGLSGGLGFVAPPQYAGGLQVTL